MNVKVDSTQKKPNVSHVADDSERRAGSTAALIIGFTIQGLAIARALSKEGIVVYAIERSPGGGLFSMRHPVFHTRHVKFSYFENLLDKNLIVTLLEYRQAIPEERVVLYPASDNTVAALARYWDELDGHYVLSWHDCRDEIAKIIQKGCLPSYCDSVGVRYPKTAIIQSDSDVDSCIESLAFPMLVKPNKPASSFKTHICSNKAELLNFAKAESSNWPLVVQEWIDGPDSNLYFYNCFLVHGKEHFGMAGRKVRASPPNLGRATVTETSADPGVCEVSQQLLKAFQISGPVALEFKKDNLGQYWFIEANVGRTEFCVDLPIQAGFNLPYIEFMYALRRVLPEVREVDECIWYDTDKEPFSHIVLCAKERTFQPHGKKQVFPYMGQERLVVLMAALVWSVAKISERVLRKIESLRGNANAY